MNVSKISLYHLRKRRKCKEILTKKRKTLAILEDMHYNVICKFDVIKCTI